MKLWSRIGMKVVQPELSQLTNDRKETSLKATMDNTIPCPPEGPCRVTKIGDTQCPLGALKIVMTVLGPQFANRILELKSTKKLQRFEPG
jgi:hypothetical protein